MSPASMPGWRSKNNLVVTNGLKAGDIVASAGVSYLVDQQKVTLLPVEE